MSNDFDRLASQLDAMTDADRKAFAERIKSDTQHVFAPGDSVSCLMCGLPAKKRKSHDGMQWDIECVCGWSASGCGPGHAKN